MNAWQRRRAQDKPVSLTKSETAAKGRHRASGGGGFDFGSADDWSDTIGDVVGYLVERIFDLFDH